MKRFLLLFFSIFSLSAGIINSSLIIDKKTPSHNHINNIHSNVNTKNSKSNINYSHKNINDEDYIKKHFIQRQQKLNAVELNRSNVAVNGASGLGYNFNVTYNTYSPDGYIKTNTELFGANSSNDWLNGKNTFNKTSGVITNDIFNIKVHINGLAQPNVAVKLDSHNIDELKIIEASSYKNKNIYYSIDASGIITNPDISLHMHYLDANGKKQDIVIGKYGVYNFFMTNASWAISLSVISSLIVLPILLKSIIDITLVSVYTTSKLYKYWSLGKGVSETFSYAQNSTDIELNDFSNLHNENDLNKDNLLNNSKNDVNIYKSNSEPITSLISNDLTSSKGFVSSQNNIIKINNLESEINELVKEDIWPISEEPYYDSLYSPNNINTINNVTILRSNLENRVNYLKALLPSHINNINISVNFETITDEYILNNYQRMLENVNSIIYRFESGEINIDDNEQEVIIFPFTGGIVNFSDLPAIPNNTFQTVDSNIMNVDSLSRVNNDPFDFGVSDTLDEPLSFDNNYIEYDDEEKVVVDVLLNSGRGRGGDINKKYSSSSSSTNSSQKSFSAHRNKPIKIDTDYRDGYYDKNRGRQIHSQGYQQQYYKPYNHHGYYPNPRSDWGGEYQNNRGSYNSHWRDRTDNSGWNRGKNKPQNHLHKTDRYWKNARDGEFHYTMSQNANPFETTTVGNNEIPYIEQPTYHNEIESSQTTFNNESFENNNTILYNFSDDVKLASIQFESETNFQSNPLFLGENLGQPERTFGGYITPSLSSCMTFSIEDSIDHATQLKSKWFDSKETFTTDETFLNPTKIHQDFDNFDIIYNPQILSEDILTNPRDVIDESNEMINPITSTNSDAVLDELLYTKIDNKPTIKALFERQRFNEIFTDVFHESSEDYKSKGLLFVCNTPDGYSASITNDYKNWVIISFDAQNQASRTLLNDIISCDDDLNSWGKSVYTKNLTKLKKFDKISKDSTEIIYSDKADNVLMTKWNFQLCNAIHTKPMFYIRTDFNVGSKLILLPIDFNGFDSLEDYNQALLESEKLNILQEFSLVHRIGFRLDGLDNYASINEHNYFSKHFDRLFSDVISLSDHFLGRVEQAIIDNSTYMINLAKFNYQLSSEESFFYAQINNLHEKIYLTQDLKFNGSGSIWRVLLSKQSDISDDLKSIILSSDKQEIINIQWGLLNKYKNTRYLKLTGAFDFSPTTESIDYRDISPILIDLGFTPELIQSITEFSDILSDSSYMRSDSSSYYLSSDSDSKNVSRSNSWNSHDTYNDSSSYYPSSNSGSQSVSRSISWNTQDEELPDDDEMNDLLSECVVGNNDFANVTLNSEVKYNEENDNYTTADNDTTLIENDSQFFDEQNYIINPEQSNGIEQNNNEIICETDDKSKHVNILIKPIKGYRWIDSPTVVHNEIFGDFSKLSLDQVNRKKIWLSLNSESDSLYVKENYYFTNNGKYHRPIDFNEFLTRKNYIRTLRSAYSTNTSVENVKPLLSFRQRTRILYRIGFRLDGSDNYACSTEINYFLINCKSILFDNLIYDENIQKIIKESIEYNNKLFTSLTNDSNIDTYYFKTARQIHMRIFKMDCEEDFWKLYFDCEWLNG